MSEILGHDVDGRPLRAGDRVVVLQAKRKPKYIGETVTIFGETVTILGRCPCEPKYAVETDIPYDGLFWDHYSIYPHRVRRIDDRPELGSWDDVEKVTGWNPVKRGVEA